MRQYTKFFSLLIASLMLSSLFSGCATIYSITAPKEYKTDLTPEDGSYPFDTMPVYEGAVIYEYEDSDESITLTAGSEDEFKSVYEFYMSYFAENEFTLYSEKDRSSEYFANGEAGYYEFEITVEKPSDKWEERLYGAIIKIELDKVNIPEKTKLNNYIKLLDEDFEVISGYYKIYDMLDESDEEDYSYYYDEIDEVLTSIGELEDSLSQRYIPNLEAFSDINKTELEIISNIKDIYLDNREILQYAEGFEDAYENLDVYNTTYYDTLAEDYEKMIYYYGKFSSGLKALEAPSFIYDFHENLKEIVDETIASGQYCLDAIYLGDNIRYFAGLYSFEINSRDLDLIYGSFSDDLDEMDENAVDALDELKDVQAGIEEWLESAKAEIKADAESITEFPEKLKIGEVETQIICDYDYPDNIIPANYRSLDYIAFMEISTNTGTTTAKITVEIPGFTQKYEQKIELSSAETEINIHPPLIADVLDTLNSSKDAQLVITVEDLTTGELVVQDTQSITIYSRYDMQWWDENDISYIENILAWVTPEAPEISTLLRAAADSANYLTDGELDSMIGYQYNSDWSEAYTTYVQAASIMHTLSSELGVTYIAQPFSSTNTNLQRVKTPAQVIDDKGGLCAETAVTVASALQAMGMHAVLILLPGHMQTAVETWYGSGEYLLIETTALTSAADEDFASVIRYLYPDEWYDYLNQYGYYVIDCDLAEQYGIKAID